MFTAFFTNCHRLQAPPCRSHYGEAIVVMN